MKYRYIILLTTVLTYSCREDSSKEILRNNEEVKYGTGRLSGKKLTQKEIEKLNDSDIRHEAKIRKQNNPIELKFLQNKHN